MEKLHKTARERDFRRIRFLKKELARDAEKWIENVAGKTMIREVIFYAGNR